MAATGTPLSADVNTFITGLIYQAMLLHTSLQNSVGHKVVSSSPGQNTARDTEQSAPTDSTSVGQASDSAQEERPQQQYMRDSHQYNFSSISGKGNGTGIITEPLSIEKSERDMCKPVPVIVVDSEENPDGVEGHMEENSEQQRFMADSTDESEGLGQKKIPEQEPDLQQSQYLELQVIKELKEKAMRLKEILLRRFKAKQMSNENRKRKTKRQADEQSNKTYAECSYPNCAYGANRRPCILLHIATHYPDAYFCPVCFGTFSRMDALDRHFRGAVAGRDSTRSRRRKQCRKEGHRKDIPEPEEFRYNVTCLESEEALRYEVRRDKKRFNFYYLGVMEDYDMSEEHFEILAGRKRGSATW